MDPVLAISTGTAIVGWLLVGIGSIAAALGVAISALEAFRKALATSGGNQALTAEDAGSPWKDVIDALKDILKELLGKTGGPTFVMGLILVAVGVLVLEGKF